MKKSIWIIGGIAIVVALILVLNCWMVVFPTQSKIRSDSRNDGIKVWVYYKYLINPGILKIDLRNISGEKSKADIFRVFLQVASSLKNKNFNTIELACKGVTKYTIKGEYFSMLGNEYDTQNPVYTMRTFPENLFLPSGEVAFEQWTGGVLGVLKEQMDDFNEFMDHWILNDLNGLSPH